MPVSPNAQQANDITDSVAAALADHDSVTLRFEHPDGKWYIITARDSYLSEAPFGVSRQFGGKGNKRPGRMSRNETRTGLRDVILDRLNHKYGLVSTVKGHDTKAA